ncbi:MAG: helix-turn-helix domain-containing protein, partial [Chloroflexota bacterium]
MFKIGEFAALTQVAISQLRYYDEIGLFTPAHVDPDTNYRYYTADQIPLLDRIIVLRELGFSLDQIRDLGRHQVSQEQIWRILDRRREQIIQNVREEVARLRQLEARLEQFAHQGDLATHRVVIKQAEEQRFMFAQASTLEEHRAQTHTLYEEQYHIKTRKHLLAVVHDTRTDTPYEIGCVVDGRAKRGVTLPSGLDLMLRTLPATPQMASIVYAGRWDDSHNATQALGFWLEQH